MLELSQHFMDLLILLFQVLGDADLGVETGNVSLQSLFLGRKHVLSVHFVGAVDEAVGIDRGLFESVNRLSDAGVLLSTIDHQHNGNKK